MWETQVRSLGGEDPLEEGMATHSSILAWRIPKDHVAWWATVYDHHKESNMTERLNTPVFQYFCLENSMNRRAWQATVHEVAGNQTHLND